MEELIKQAFLHIDKVGPHVQEGHYDLLGPNGEIILPQVWESVIEPDLSVTMHMWPMPERESGPSTMVREPKSEHAEGGSGGGALSTDEGTTRIRKEKKSGRRPG